MADKVQYPVRPLRFRLMNRIVRYAPVTAKYHHNSILFRKTVDVPEIPVISAGYEFRPATREDLDFIMNHPEALMRDVYAKRLERGDRCYCLSNGKEIVSYNWVAFSLCCVLCGFDRGVEFFPLSKEQAFTYDFYTYKARRGGGLGSAAKQILVSTLAGQGIREVYTLVMPYSTASLKIHLRLGYEPMGMVYGYRILGWSRTYYGKAGEKKWLDAWIDNFRVSARV